jgi:hypothetical protein
MISTVALLTATPAYAELWIEDTVSGVLQSGTDVHGLFGEPRSDMAGVSYSFSIYYRNKDIRQLPGNFDYAVLKPFCAGVCR